MKLPRVISISDVLPNLGEYSAIIDVRSESEFAEDHIPGAIHCPVLNDAERAHVGTLYKQVSSFEAKKIGAALVAHNIARHIEEHFLKHPKDWHPLIYCWRGGNRSGAMALILAQIGWKADVVEGGYKAYRRAVIAASSHLSPRYSFKVLCGPTGSGKTRLLGALALAGAQVLDLESLAAHRGSVLGGYPHADQPSQKMFESRLWEILRRFDPAQPVFVEAESKRVGQVHVPDPLIDAIRQGQCIQLDTPLPVRVALLQDEYQHFLDDTVYLAERLSFLVPLHGHKTIQRWLTLVKEGNSAAFVESMLREHYDPSYTRSMRRNFPAYGEAISFSVSRDDAQTFSDLAHQLKMMPDQGT
jgi:tRNA 2-selenouridine synthase